MTMKYKQEPGLNIYQLETQERLTQFLGTTVNHTKLLNSIEEAQDIIKSHDFFDEILKRTDKLPARKRRVQRFYDIIALSLYQGKSRKEIINILNKMKDKDVQATSYLRREMNDILITSYWKIRAKKDAELDNNVSSLLIELY